MAETWQACAATVSVCESAPVPMLALRLRGPSRDDLARIGGLIEADLPRVPNRVSEGLGRAIWTGPDEWLLVGASLPCSEIEAAACDAAAALCVSVGDGRCSFEVTGASAADLLAKGTSVDLHPGVFTKAMSVLTLFAQASAVIDRPSGLDGFRMIFDVSIRDYLRLWFREALVEFG